MKLGTEQPAYSILSSESSEKTEPKRDRSRATEKRGIAVNPNVACEILLHSEEKSADLHVGLRHLLSFPSPCDDDQDHRQSWDSVHDLKIRGLFSALKNAITYNDQAVKECGMLKIATMDFAQCPNESWPSI